MAGVDVEAMHRICTHLFDMVYLQWDDVYRELASRSSKSSAHSDGRLQEDTMWLAAAVVGSASFFHDQAASDEVQLAIVYNLLLLIKTFIGADS